MPEVDLHAWERRWTGGHYSPEEELASKAKRVWRCTRCGWEVEDHQPTEFPRTPIGRDRTGQPSREEPVNLREGEGVGRLTCFENLARRVLEE